MSDSLILLFTKELPCAIRSLKKSDVSNLLVIRANQEQKASDLFEKFLFFVSFPPFYAYLLFFKEQIEQFAPVALYKRATLSNSLRSLMTKEWQKICLGPSWQKRDGRDLLFFTSESLFR